MAIPILKVDIRSERDTVSARQRSRQIARLLGFDTQDQTRISTAVSEIARNTYNYASGGRVEYLIEGVTAPQLFLIRISDTGPGIQDLDSILQGRYRSTTGMGLGIVGARRLMDQFEIESTPGGGTTVWLKKLLPRRAPLVLPPDIARIAGELAAEKPQDAIQELQHQNRELLAALEEIRTRQAELTRVNRELEDTNRGVVALYAELDEQAGHLRRADEIKSRFLSNMSHEFRSPLNSILALSRLLLEHADGDLNSEQNQQVGFIRKAAQDLLEIVNDLLDLAKVEAGKVDVKPLEFEVKNLFAALRGMLRPLLLNQSIDLVFEDTDDIPAVFSDEGKVSQILRNFISNSLKFTESGEVRVSAAVVDDQIRFSVADTGIGIAPEDQETIFQDFAQVDHPLQRRVKGTGLGLPLSRKLAVLLGGSVSVASRRGSGSTFSVQIPLRYIDPREENVAEPLSEWIADPGSLPVLVVEDSPDAVMMYRSFLKASGFQVISAPTTRDAEDVLASMRPVVIVLDIILRSEDTWALMARLKQSALTREIPILVASTIEDHAKAYHLGADGYLVKPVERLALINSLRSLTGQPPLHRVLIIDDDPQHRYLIQLELRGTAVAISEAANGAEGLQRASVEKPDVIILDLTMPAMSGFAVLDSLKADPATARIPVIICSSRILEPADRERLTGKAAAIVNKEALSGLRGLKHTVREAVTVRTAG